MKQHPYSHPPQPQTPTTATRKVRKFKSTVQGWLIEFDGEKAALTGPAGLQSIWRILAGDHAAKAYIWITPSGRAVHDTVTLVGLYPSR